MDCFGPAGRGEPAFGPDRTSVARRELDPNQAQGASESAWVLLLLGAWSVKIRLGWFEVSAVRLLDFEGCAHVEFALKVLVVPPPHVFDGGELDVFDRAP